MDGKWVIKGHIKVDISKRVQDGIQKKRESERKAQEKVAKMPECISAALWRNKADFLKLMAANEDKFHSFIFVDLDNVFPPRTASAPAGVAVICVGKSDSFKKLLRNSSHDLSAFQESGSLFCFACGDYSEAADEDINFLGIALARSVRGRSNVYVYLSSDRVYSITAEGAETQDGTARTSCISPANGVKVYTIDEVMNAALLRINPRVEAPPMASWWPWH